MAAMAMSRAVRLRLLRPPAPPLSPAWRLLRTSLCASHGEGGATHVPLTAVGNEPPDFNYQSSDIALHAPLTATKAAISLDPSLPPFTAAQAEPAPLTEVDVAECQRKWAGAIKSISKTFLDKADYIAEAGEAASELYGYGHMQVLFKPTKAAMFPFRPTAGEAMSYFVGGGVTEGGYAEDAGFAINGGKGWKDVVFTNHAIQLLGDAAIAMGSYEFTCATTGDVAKVEYTFGYKRCDDGKPRIFLHHSSVPYTTSP